MSLLLRRGAEEEELIELLLDKYPATLPAFHLPKQISTSFTGDFITVVKNDGITNPSLSFSFENYQFPSASILSFLGGEKGLVSSFKAQNQNAFFTQTSLLAMPIIAEGGVLITDSEGDIGMRFDGSQFMVCSTDFSSIINADAKSFYLAFQFSQSAGIYFIVGDYGSSVQKAFWTAIDGSKAETYINNPGINKVYVRPAVTKDVQIKKFTTIDILNPIASERCIDYINGVESKLNTVSDSTALASSSYTPFYLGRATGGSFFYKGIISSFIPFGLNYNDNRSEIISMI